MKTLILLLLPLLLVACDGAESTTVATDETRTAPDQATAAFTSLPEALAKAKESDTNVLVIYGSKTCPYSRQMDEQTLSDNGVNAAMNKFVVLRLEKGENSAEFEKAWGKQPTPTVVTLSPDGKPVGRMLNGVVQKSDFLAYAAWAQTGEGAQPSIATGGG